MVYPSTPYPSVAPSGRADILTHLLEQPHELIGEVVRWLELKDLLNLRITSRSLHQLVHSHEQAICARYYGRLRHQHAALQLPVSLRGFPNDLVSYIELQHSYEPIHQLSLAFSHHIATKLRLESPLPTKEVECRWRERKTLLLHRQLFPWLFALNSFLESLRNVFIRGDEDFATLSDSTYLSLQDVYDLDQQHIIQDVYSWSRKSIVNITAALGVFIGIAAAKRLALESKAPEYPFASVKKILIFRGLVPFKAILCRPSHDATGRTEALVAASRRVMHGAGPRRIVDLKLPLPSIHHLDTDRLEAPAQQSSRGTNIGNAFVGRQDLWYKAAYAVVQRKDMPRSSFPPNTDKWLCKMLKETDDPPFSLSAWTKPDSTDPP
ncbi:hypothetical protein DV737_g1856, partial [Chaetothyriales sp. CBS 132003]